MALFSTNSLAATSMVGASLTGETDPVTSAVVLCRPSVTVYSKEILPLKSGAGVNTSWPLLRVTVPLLMATEPPSAMA
ncbi:hypothetical protein D3C78_1542960 [compost metagenome]